MVTVAIGDDQALLDSPPIAWAIDSLRRSAAGAGCGDGTRVTLVANDEPCLSVGREDEGVTLRGSVGALVYGLTDAAGTVEMGGDLEEALRGCDGLSFDGAVPIRSMSRAFSSVRTDSAWFHDRTFWTEYLDWLAYSRFNQFHLALGMQYNYGADQGASDNYLCFPYPFLLDVEGWDVYAEGVDAAERGRNLESLRYVSQEVRRRGMHFQLGLWTNAYSYGNNDRPWYPIRGLTQQNHAAYCGAAIKALLLACPAIDGLTLRVHYEGGVSEHGNDQVWSTIFDEVSAVGRPITIDMHAKGVDESLIASAKKPNLTPMLSAKYLAEHMGLPYHQISVRAREARPPTGVPQDAPSYKTAARNFTRYSYGDFLPENRDIDVMFRIWPGTQKVLLWGDPELAAGYGRLSTFCGSRGLDICEPLYFYGRRGSAVSDSRDPYREAGLQLDGQEWKKYKYTYLIWGRLLHDPDAHPEQWRRYLRFEYGESARLVESALSALSKILPLVTVAHGVGASNNGYSPEMYTDLPLSRQTSPADYCWDTDGEPVWGEVSALDPGMFYSINEYVRDLVDGSVDPRYSPLEVAIWLEGMVERAAAHVSALERVAEPSAQLRRTIIDCRMLMCLGAFFAWKFRAATAYARFQQTTIGADLEEAISHLEQAREAYSTISDYSNGNYVDILYFGLDEVEQGDWARRTKALAFDIRNLKNERPTATNDVAVAVPDPPTRLSTQGFTHTPPKVFRRGQPVPVELQLAEEGAAARVVLRYRRIDQSQPLESTELSLEGRRARSEIPASYTDSDFSLMYFFEVYDPGGGLALVPGLDPDLANQPYWVLRAGE